MDQPGRIPSYGLGEVMDEITIDLSQHVQCDCGIWLPQEVVECPFIELHAEGE